jgi:hypothetical protein
MGRVSGRPERRPASGVAERAGLLPTFLVIGAQKSATTSVIHYLGGHPDVFALRDEVHFFDRHYDRGIDWYRLRFAGGEEALEVGESTPEYMYFEEVPARMAQHVPAARLVAILRNPVDRAYSHYWHNRTRGVEPLAFEDALDSEEERLSGGDPVARSRYSYLDRGRYLPQLQRVREHFPGDLLRVELFEDLQRDRTAVVRSLYRFLGLEEGIVPEGIDRARNRFVSFRSQRLRKPIRRLPGPLRRVAARLNIRYTEYPSLPPAVRARLHERFADDNSALASWLGRDLSLWDA